MPNSYVFLLKNKKKRKKKGIEQISFTEFIKSSVSLNNKRSNEDIRDSIYERNKK